MLTSACPPPWAWLTQFLEWPCRSDKREGDVAPPPGMQLAMGQAPGGRLRVCWLAEGGW
jgi:hypothetical protein